MTETPEKRDQSDDQESADAAHDEELQQNLRDAIEAKNEADIASDLQKILDEF